MKTVKCTSVLLWIIFLVFPISLLAQVKEIPVTTTSKEALKLFLDGRDKLENIENVAAAPLFDQAIQKDPGFALAYLYRAQSGGGYEIQHQNLNKAIGLADKASEGEKLLIRYFQAIDEGNGLKQKESLDQLLKLFPSDKRVQLMAGNYYYFTLGDYSGALNYFTKASELDKNFAPTCNMLGYCQAALNNYPEAEKAFQAYITLSPNSANPYDSYAELLLKMGKYDESIAQYKKAAEKDPVNFAGSLAGVGNNYIFKGDYESARKYYQEYYDKAPAFSGKLAALYLKAVSYVHEGNMEKAVAGFEEFRSMAEKENQMAQAIRAYIYEGEIYAESGKPAEGMKYYEKANELLGKSKFSAPEKENINLNLMLWKYYFLTANNELDKANAELEKSRQMVESRKNPGEEKLLNSLTAFYALKKGDFDKAIQDFSKADKDDPMNWYYLAVAYDKKGDKQNASKLFEKITKDNNNSLNLALVRKRAMEEMKK